MVRKVDEKVYFNTFEQYKKAVSKAVKDEQYWEVILPSANSQNSLIFGKKINQDQYLFKVTVNSEFKLNLNYFGWKASDKILNQFMITKNTAKQLFRFIEGLNVCSGVSVLDKVEESCKVHLTTAESETHNYQSINTIAYRL